MCIIFSFSNLENSVAEMHNIMFPGHQILRSHPKSKSIDFFDIKFVRSRQPGVISLMFRENEQFL